MGASLKTRINPMERNTREPESLRLTPRCGAKGRIRCRLHGGARGSGAPKGEANGRYSHGLLTVEAMEERNALLEILERGK
jgi:glucans biosynthesis protein